ncbi:type II toxin-antitoxin system RelE family toxin [Lacticaseibacillus zhaodongensis]|uniref:type II toxin-antitoxin system RelE family toxin n=1 Tax=Lacticaseibacillus zhaodongensis TaxID=2668065 RepID=UPI0012D2B523|nr:type II toxin-antitoxin system RelE/ParE family toxin [Lacticaseibacillus zhaodongensis]
MSKQYHWLFAKRAAKQFAKLDNPVQRRIVQWLNTHIEGYDNPRAWGKALEGELGTLWRYRVGNYRVIADIDDGKFTVLIVKTGKRNDVYKQQ